MGIYLDALTATHLVGKTGGNYTHAEKRNLLAVIRATSTAKGLATTSDTAVQASKTATTTFGVNATTHQGLVDAQMAIMDAFGIGDIVAMLAAQVTCSALLKASATALGGTDGVAAVTAANTAGAASTAALAAGGEVLVANPVMDGY